MPATGRCLCGAVTFTAKEAETDVHCCHCSMCRRWTGAPLMAVAVRGLEFSGEDDLVRYDSSSWGQRGFCRRCGSTLFFQLKGTDRYHIAAGAFDDQSGFELAGEIFIDEKPDGYAFAGDHRRITGAEFLAMMQSSGE